MKIITIIIISALFLGNFGNFSIAYNDELNILDEKHFQTLSKNNIGLEKIEQSLLDLIYPNNKFNDFYYDQLTEFNLIDDKIKLEILLLETDKIVE